MPLRNKAVLELVGDPVTAPDGTDAAGAGVFHLPATEDTTEFDKQMLIGNRGQALQELFSLAPIGGGQGANGAGYNLDFGQGLQTFQLSFKLVQDGDPVDPDQWGDGSGTPPLDATGEHRQTQLQTLSFWARTTRTGSARTAKLYWGDWTDGTYAASAGAFGRPIDVRIMSVTAPYLRDSPSLSTPQIEFARTATVPEIVSNDPTPSN